MKPVHIFCLKKGPDYQDRTENLRRNCCDCRTCHPHIQNCYQHNVYYNIYQTACDQIIQGPFGIPYCTENSGTHVVKQVRYHPCKVNPYVHQGMAHNILRRFHCRKGPSGTCNAQNHKQQAACNGKCNGCVDRPVNLVRLFCPIILRNNNCGTTGKTHKKSHQQVDQRAGASAYRS